MEIWQRFSQEWGYRLTLLHSVQEGNLVFIN
jgi:hypothetical protein